jgi:hypothetical protein
MKYIKSTVIHNLKYLKFVHVAWARVNTDGYER